MATVTEMVSEMDDHGFGDTASTRKVSFLNDTLTDVCSREPWPFLEKTLALTFDGLSAIPSNFPADFSKALSLTDPVSGRAIPWERLDTLRKRYADSFAKVDSPAWYYFLAGKLRTLPIASSATSLNLDYLCSHPAVDINTTESGILVPVRHHRVLVLGALYKLYALEDDPENSNLFNGFYEDRILKMREDLSRLQYDRPDRIVVLDDDDFDAYPFM